MVYILITISLGKKRLADYSSDVLVLLVFHGTA